MIFPFLLAMAGRRMGGKWACRGRGGEKEEKEDSEGGGGLLQQRIVGGQPEEYDTWSKGAIGGTTTWKEHQFMPLRKLLSLMLAWHLRRSSLVSVCHALTTSTVPLMFCAGFEGRSMLCLAIGTSGLGVSRLAMPPVRRFLSAFCSASVGFASCLPSAQDMSTARPDIPSLAAVSDCSGSSCSWALVTVAPPAPNCKPPSWVKSPPFPPPLAEKAPPRLITAELLRVRWLWQGPAQRTAPAAPLDGFW